MNKSTDQTTPVAPDAHQAERAVPVKSAKDAINAMYASDSSKRLSSYLANSAKEIINASSKPASDHKSAANLHGGSIQRSMESARPSASGLLRQAKPEPTPVPEDTSAASDPLAQRSIPVVRRKPTPAASSAAPVVRTSLKLGPKRSPIVSRPKRPATTNNGMRTRKTPVNLTKIIPSTPTPAEREAQAIKAAAQKSIRKVSPPSVHPQGTKLPKRRGGLMQDVVRPIHAARPTQQAQMKAASAATPTFAASLRSTGEQLPPDSVKHRFQAAPRGYATTTSSDSHAQFASYVSEERTTAPARPPRKPAVEIYGMMDDEPSTPIYQAPLSEPEPPADYVPADAVPETSLATPDNNRYALGGQSPFFLKSVSVEKRPLSDAPIKPKTTPEGALYQHPSTEPVSTKNVYEKPKSREKKPIPAKPTVIIPASRRSRAPLILLIIMTIVLGAAVGALTYFCFFQ